MWVNPFWFGVLVTVVTEVVIVILLSVFVGGRK